MMDEIIKTINSSPFVLGVMMILLNLFSRYIVHELSDNEQEYRDHIILRRVAVFAVCFVATHDVVNSLILTASFVILATGIFQGKSAYAREGMKNATDVEGAIISTA